MNDIISQQWVDLDTGIAIRTLLEEVMEECAVTFQYLSYESDDKRWCVDIGNADGNWEAFGHDLRTAAYAALDAYRQGLE